MTDFLSTDQTTASAKEAEVKSMYLQGLSHSTVSTVLLLLFACFLAARKALLVSSNYFGVYPAPRNSLHWSTICREKYSSIPFFIYNLSSCAAYYFFRISMTSMCQLNTVTVFELREVILEIKSDLVCTLYTGWKHVHRVASKSIQKRHRPPSHSGGQSEEFLFGPLQGRIRTKYHNVSLLNRIMHLGKLFGSYVWVLLLFFFSFLFFFFVF